MKNRLLLMILVLMVIGCTDKPSDRRCDMLLVKFTEIETPSPDREIRSILNLSIRFNIEIVNNTEDEVILNLEKLRKEDAYLTIIGEKNRDVLNLSYRGCSISSSRNRNDNSNIGVSLLPKTVEVLPGEKASCLYKCNFSELYTHISRVRYYADDNKYNIIMTVKNTIDTSIVIATINLNGNYISIGKNSEINICNK